MAIREANPDGVEPVHSLKISRPAMWDSARGGLPKFSGPEAMSETLSSSHGIKVEPERLRELSAAGCLPHYEIDGKGPYFYPSELKDYFREKMIVGKGAREFPERLIVIDPDATKIDLASLPHPLLPIANQLFQLQTAHMERAGVVYFLLAGFEVVYVGQTTTLASRIATHLKEKAGEFDRVLYMFVPTPNLVQVETQFIRALNPRLNWVGRKEAKAAKEVKASA